MSENQNALRFKTSDITSFVLWLSKLPLGGKESRERTRFLRLTSPFIQDFEKSRVELAQKYARKDESGNPVKVRDEKGERYDFDPMGIVTFTQELAELLKEEIVIDILPSNRQTLVFIKTITLNTDFQFSGDDAEWYDSVCGIFEEAKL